MCPLAKAKMIMNGTVTMARGLMSLHNRGEELSLCPMSIGDLISLGSYHFRKSYLGVLQTAKSHPEVSRRLLMNQIGWANTLLRLYKTKEKLETPVVVRPAPAELPGEVDRERDIFLREALRHVLFKEFVTRDIGKPDTFLGMKSGDRAEGDGRVIPWQIDMTVGARLIDHPVDHLHFTVQPIHGGD